MKRSGEIKKGDVGAFKCLCKRKCLSSAESQRQPSLESSQLKVKRLLLLHISPSSLPQHPKFPFEPRHIFVSIPSHPIIRAKLSLPIIPRVTSNAGALTMAACIYALPDPICLKNSLSFSSLFISLSISSLAVYLFLLLLSLPTFTLSTYSSDLLNLQYLIVG